MVKNQISLFVHEDRQTSNHKDIPFLLQKRGNHRNDFIYTNVGKIQTPGSLLSCRWKQFSRFIGNFSRDSNPRGRRLAVDVEEAGPCEPSRTKAHPREEIYRDGTTTTTSSSSSLPWKASKKEDRNSEERRSAHGNLVNRLAFPEASFANQFPDWLCTRLPRADFSALVRRKIRTSPVSAAHSAWLLNGKTDRQECNIRRLEGGSIKTRERLVLVSGNKDDAGMRAIFLLPLIVG